MKASAARGVQQQPLLLLRRSDCPPLDRSHGALRSYHRARSHIGTMRAAGKASSSAANRGRIDERTWADVRRAAIIARDTGMALRVHGRCVEVTGVLKQPSKFSVTKVESKPQAAAMKAEAAAVPLVPTVREDASSPACSSLPVSPSS